MQFFFHSPVILYIYSLYFSLSLHPPPWHSSNGNSNTRHGLPQCSILIHKCTQYSYKMFVLLYIITIWPFKLRGGGGTERVRERQKEKSIVYKSKTICTLIKIKNYLPKRILRQVTSFFLYIYLLFLYYSRLGMFLIYS